jgi:hypothetical protein
MDGAENTDLIMGWYKDLHSMCHWRCNSVSSGIIALVMISLSVQDNSFAVNVWRNKQFLLHCSVILSSHELLKEVQIRPLHSSSG